MDETNGDDVRDLIIRLLELLQCWTALPMNNFQHAHRLVLNALIPMSQCHHGRLVDLNGEGPLRLQFR